MTAENPDSSGPENAQWHPPMVEAVEPLRPPTIEEQRMSLATIQMGHMETMRETGLDRRITDMLGTQNEGVQVMASKAGTPESDDVIFRAKVGKYNLTEAGQEFVTFTDVDVARTVGDTVMPESDAFSFDDAEMFAGFVAELDLLRDDGILPNLNVLNSEISDPSAQMRQMPAAEQ